MREPGFFMFVIWNEKGVDCTDETISEAFMSLFDFVHDMLGLVALEHSELSKSTTPELPELSHASGNLMRVYTSAGRMTLAAEGSTVNS